MSNLQEKKKIRGERKFIMRDITDTKLYTRYERFKAGEEIFDYIFSNCIPKYDKLIINKHNKSFIYTYVINDISIKIILNSESKIFYELVYKKESQQYRFTAPNETIEYEDYKKILMYFFDKLLYSIYLSATDPSYMVKNVEGINKNFETTLKDR